jgi:6-oxo-cyclohex-1-ene-carbonyl-CoA hydrolase
MEFKNHDLAPFLGGKVRYERKPVRDPQGRVIEDLSSVWITLDNQTQLNSYDTDMIKQVILGFRRASNERDAVAVVFTGAGNRAFCTGGNTKEYAEYYSGRPDEYRSYMRLFNDMVSAILACDRPVICRVNGMRVGGGQEIGMACDFSISSDLANYAQAGPRHGSAPDGGATDFLPLYTGIERAMASLTLCEPWTAYQAHAYGVILEIVQVLKVDGKFVPNPFVVTDRWIDERGRMVYGTLKTGAAKEEAKKVMERGEIDLAPLDAAVESLVTKLLMTFPGCTLKTIESVRKHKLAHWDLNREQNREWLALNMMNEANAGFRAFNEGPKGKREIDFVDLRRRLARGEVWGRELIDAVQPREDGTTGGRR